MRKAFFLEIEHEVDVTLAVELDALRAVPMGAPNAQAVEHLDEFADLVRVVDELDELDAVDGRQRRGRPPPNLLVEPQERAHAVEGDPAS